MAHVAGHPVSAGAETCLERTLAAVAARVDGALGQLPGVLAADGGFPGAPAGRLEVDLIGELRERAAHHGKRFRPKLAYWGYAAVAGEPSGAPESLVAVGAALELLHLFALIQDDVMDRSHTRRGRPTMHVEVARSHREHGGRGDAVLFGDSVATLAGDLALAEANHLVAPCAEPVRDLWRAMTVELVEGQLLDLTHAASRSRDPQISRRIALLKSGRYTITRPLQLGATLAGADHDLTVALGAWGDRVGEAFAIRDDVLGVWGDPAQTGKPAGDDLVSGKPTVLLSWSRERIEGDPARLLARCDVGEMTPAEVPALQEALVAAGVLDLAEQTITRDIEQARALLEALPIRDAARVALSVIADDVAWRST